MTRRFEIRVLVACAVLSCTGVAWCHATLSGDHDQYIDAWHLATADLRSVVFAGAECGWAVGEAGTVLHTSDGGTSWQPQQSFTIQALYDVFFLPDRQHGWIVGDRGIVLRTNDGGRRWRQHPVDRAGILRSVCFLDERRGWAVGPGGVILRSSDGGETWSELRLPVQEELRAVSFVDADHGWIVGASGTVLVTKDGEHWESGSVGRRVDLFDVQFQNRQSGWAVGEQGWTFRSDDGGRNWSSSKYKKGGMLRAVSVAGSAVWALVEDGEVRAYESDAWQPVNADELAHTTLYGLHAEAESGRVWIVGERGIIFRRSRDAWELQHGQPDDARHQHRRSVWFTDMHTGLVASGNRILRTTDGGDRWMETKDGAAEDEPRINAIRFLDSDIGWAVGDAGTLLSTEDGGKSWHRKTLAETDLNDVWFHDERNGWVVGNGGTLLRTVDGKSWITQPLSRQNNLNAIAFHGRTSGTIVGNSGFILVTEDGLRWEPSPTTIREDLQSVCFQDERRAWTVGDKGTVLLKEGAEGQWSPQSIDQVARSVNLSDVWFLPAEPFGWIVGERTMLATRDGGKSWDERALLVPKSAQLRSIQVLRGMSAGWVVGDRAVLSLVPIRIPKLVRFEAKDAAEGIAVEGQFDSPYPIEVALSYRLDDEEEERPLSNDGLEVHDEGRFSYSWTGRLPERVRSGEAVRFVARADNGAIVVREETAKPVRHHARSLLPWYAELGLLAVVGYGLSLGFLYWRRPVGLVWWHRRSPIQALLSLVPWRWPEDTVRPALGWLTTHLCTRPRTVRGWAEAYKRASVSLDDLSPTLRTRYLSAPEVLDAWVVRRRVQALAVTQGLALEITKHGIYIPLPLQLEADRIDRPNAAALRPWFNGQARLVVQLVGSGGTGKSTLASQIALWAAAGGDSDRLAEHPMIPVFLDEQSDDIGKAIADRLAEMFPGDLELQQDVVANLLRCGRLLVILDRVSEWDSSARAAVESIHGRLDVARTIVTSRRPIHFASVRSVVARLQPFDEPTLFRFVQEYMKQSKAALPEDLRNFQNVLGHSLLELLNPSHQAGDVTPLIVRMFLDDTLEQASRDGQLHAKSVPVRIPEIFIRYLGRVVGAWNVHGDPVRVCRELGKLSLGTSYVASEFFEGDAVMSLDTVLGGGGREAIGSLRDAGILVERERGGERLLQFQLDPLAEYLGALDRIHWARAAGAEPWKAWVRDELDGRVGIESFQTALRDCIDLYRADFHLGPEIALAVAGSTVGAAVTEGSGA